jgi:hypothetical protein
MTEIMSSISGAPPAEDNAVQAEASEPLVLVRDASCGKVGAASIPLAQYIPPSKTGN